jgi:lipoyl-dependent peroxiredoxin
MNSSMDDAVAHLTLAAADISTSNRRSIRVAPDQALNILAAVALSGSASVVIAMENDESSRTSVEVGVGQNSEGGYALDIDPYVELSGLPEPAAKELVEATHHVCPYSNAVRGNVEVQLHVFVK